MAQGVPPLQQLQQMRGSDVVDSSGEKIGSLEDVYVDRETGQPEWVGVKKGLMGRSHVLVPLSGAQPAKDSLTVAVAKERVDDAPDIDDEEISESTEADLYRHYGIQPNGGAPQARAGETQAGYAGTADRPAGETRARRGEMDREAERGARDDDSMTLHEERVNIGKQQVPAGTARLRKFVETDRIEQDVPLRSERAEVTRERIDQPAPGATFGEGSAEIDLQREEAVVDKETYATERVSLGKESEVTQQHVSEEVSRERAEIEGEERQRRASLEGDDSKLSELEREERQRRGARGKDQPNL